MAVTGARRAQETGGRPIETPLAYLGFGPAPKYVESSAVQNRIAHLYREHVAPGARPYQDPEVSSEQQTARNRLLMARQFGTGEEKQAALDAALKSGLSPGYLATVGRVSSDQRMFAHLPHEDQMAIFKQADPEERQRYWAYASNKTRRAWGQAATEYPGRRATAPLEARP
jgi:hypothetical protein